jgi:hypothetical protein
MGGGGSSIGNPHLIPAGCQIADNPKGWGIEDAMQHGNITQAVGLADRSFAIIEYTSQRYDSTYMDYGLDTNNPAAVAGWCAKMNRFTDANQYTAKFLDALSLFREKASDCPPDFRPCTYTFSKHGFEFVGVTEFLKLDTRDRMFNGFDALVKRAIDFENIGKVKGDMGYGLYHHTVLCSYGRELIIPKVMSMTIKGFQSDSVHETGLGGIHLTVTVAPAQLQPKGGCNSIGTQVAGILSGLIAFIFPFMGTPLRYASISSNAVCLGLNDEVRNQRYIMNVQGEPTNIVLIKNPEKFIGDWSVNGANLVAITSTKGLVYTLTDGAGSKTWRISKCNGDAVKDIVEMDRDEWYYLFI